MYKFDNGYGAIVVKGALNYGHEDGLSEVAVLKWTDDTSRIVYDTTITDDVIGRLSDEQVEELLKEIETLK